MGPDLRHRISLLARIGAGLLAVAYLLVLSSRGGSGHRSTAVPTPSPKRAVATPTAVLPAPPPARTLCQAVPALVQFSVQTLYLPLPDGGVNVSNSVTVNEPAAARTLARQLCGLPPEPGNPASCASPAGHWTQFIFGSASNAYWAVWVDSAGCMAVLGAGTRTRTALPDKRLWPTVVADLHDGVPLGSPVG